MLREKTFFEKIDKVKTAIERLKHFEPEEGFYLAFSGGKDSIVIKKLADMANVKYDVHYSVTTIDPPELIYFIRKHHKEVIFEYPEKPFLTRLAEKGFPLRQARWCCAEYKETGGSGRFVVTGIRSAESASRANRKMVETCYKDTTKRFLHVIHDWLDEDVWQFIREEKMPYCTLYDEGYDRIGCMFCPLAKQSARDRDYKRYPKFVKLWEKAFEELYQNKKAKGLTSVDRWKDGKEMFKWWINKTPEKHIPAQFTMFE